MAGLPPYAAFRLISAALPDPFLYQSAVAVRSVSIHRTVRALFLGTGAAVSHRCHKRRLLRARPRTAIEGTVCYQTQATILPCRLALDRI